MNELPTIVKCIKCEKGIPNYRPNKKYCSERCGDAVRTYRYKCRKRGGLPRKNFNKEEKQKRNMVNKKKYRQKIRLEFIMAYGQVCACCGDNKIEFLTLDHVNNDGHLARGKNNSGTSKRDNVQEYNKAIKQYRPDIYQILCMNCNCAKSWYGECPCKNYQR